MPTAHRNGVTGVKGECIHVDVWSSMGSCDGNRQTFRFLSSAAIIAKRLFTGDPIIVGGGCENVYGVLNCIQ